MRFRSHDVARVETTWKEYVPSAELQKVDPRRFRFDWHSGDLAGVSLVRYELAAQIHSTAQPEDQFLACRVDAADARVWSDRGDLDAGLPWFTGGARVQARWDVAADVRALVFDRTEAQTFARQVSGDDQLTLDVKDLAPTDAASAARWERMFGYLEQSLDDLAATDEIARAELGRHALAVTLGTFTTTLPDALRLPAQTRAAPAAVRRALAYIDENAHRPITVEDVAVAVHMSTRGLQYAFRRSLDLTPIDALRRARLEGARADLQTTSNDSVAMIARRWGFTHPSRFATAYRDAYGQSPSEARRRSE